VFEQKAGEGHVVRTLPGRCDWRWQSPARFSSTYTNLELIQRTAVWALDFNPLAKLLVLAGEHGWGFPALLTVRGPYQFHLASLLLPKTP